MAWQQTDQRGVFSRPMGENETFIKLTGDANVPRGECSFLVRDMGDCIQVPGQHPLGEEGETIRVVRTLGHIAHNGFSEGTVPLSKRIHDQA